MPITLQEAMDGVLRRQELQEAKEAEELRRYGQQPNPPITHRYDQGREASMSDDAAESGSDAEPTRQSSGEYIR
jgi:hypothetical protein